MGDEKKKTPGRGKVQFARPILKTKEGKKKEKKYSYQTHSGR